MRLELLGHPGLRCAERCIDASNISHSQVLQPEQHSYNKDSTAGAAQRGLVSSSGSTKLDSLPNLVLARPT